MREITVEADVKNIPSVTAFIDEELERLDCSLKSQMQIDVAIDELLSNIAFYAYKGKGKGNVSVGIESSDAGEGKKTVTITFSDEGSPYDPLQKEDPDVTLSAEERRIGGLGIFIVKKTMDDMIYERRGEKNILQIIKTI